MRREERRAGKRAKVLLDIRLFFHYYMYSETNGKPSAGAPSPHKTVEVFQKNRKLWQAAWGNGLKPAEFPNSEHAFVGKTPNEKKSREVFQKPILRPVAARLPSHSIACSLLPLAVLKLGNGQLDAVTPTRCMQPITACGIETIPKRTVTGRLASCGGSFLFPPQQSSLTLS